MAHWTNLGDLTDRNRDPEKPALIDLRVAEAPRTYSHGELDALANGVARSLAARGLARGTHVAVLSANRAEYVAAYFGIMRAGLVAVPVNIKLPRETVDYVMDDAAIALAFVDAAHAGLVRSGIPTIGFDDAGPEGFAAQLDRGPFTAVRPALGEVGQMLYTSGSTGRPKGVPLSHAGQLWALEQRAGGPGADEQRWIVAQPLFHMNGLFLTKTVIANHATLVMLPSFSARPYVEAIARYRVTSITAVPTMLARAVKEADLIATLDLSAVTRIMLGSAPLTLSLVQRVESVFRAAAVTNGFGTTEAGPAVFGPHPEGRPAPPLSVGYPLAAGEVKLIAGTTEDEGILAMRNPAVMARYHNLPDPSAKVLKDGWYVSGDVFRRDADGFFFFIGRADDMFVCSGENIYPGEVEKLLERHPAIHQASVVPLPDEERGQVPVAFIVRRPDTPLAVEEVKRFALSHGPAYQHPRRVAFVQDLPWAGTNKIDRAALIARAGALEAANGWSR